MKSFFKHMALALAVASLTAVVGCDSEEEKSYELQIAWLIGGQPFCDDSVSVDGERIDLEISELRVTVFEQEGDETFIYRDQFPCVDSDNVYTIPDLKKRRYWIEVEAFASYDGEERAYLQIAQEVGVPGDDAPIEMSLKIGTADLNLDWKFANGSFCAKNDVETIKITVGENQYEVDCVDEEFLVKDLSWGSYEISLDGVSSSGATTWRTVYDADPGTEAIEPLEVRPGDPYEISLTLEEI